MRIVVAGVRGATFAQLAQALSAPVVLTALLAPVTLWLYRRR
jgi:hypothetical protein